MGFSISQL